LSRRSAYEKPIATDSELARSGTRCPAQGDEPGAPLQSLLATTSAILADANGEEPRAWLNRFRLRLAVRCSSKGLGVKAVAHALSFKRASHFCRVFKHRNGISPRRFNGSGNGIAARRAASG